MNQPNKQQLVFGYGLSLFIPFLVLMHVVRVGPDGIPLIAFIGMAAIILAVLNRMPAGKRLYYITLSAVAVGLFILTRQHPLAILPSIWILTTPLILGITLLRPSALRVPFTLWMTITRTFGTIIQTIAFTFIYYIVFGTAGLILRILRKDLLNEKLESDKTSYWVPREPAPEDLKRYEQQF